MQPSDGPHVESTPQIIDLRTVAPHALADLWRYEGQWWRAHMCWDITDTLDALRRVVARGGVPGKAVRLGTQIVGYAYYLRDGEVGMLSGLVLAPAWDRADIGTPLLHALVEALRQQGVQRIESPGISLASSWLAPAYEQMGFRTAWRMCLRLDLASAPTPLPQQTSVTLHPWRGESLSSAATIMHAAYQATIDVEMHSLYRTVAGCHSVLEQILHQGSCGPLLPEASALARTSDKDIGFIAVTASAPRQGHLAQVAVLPAYQRQGVGRRLVEHSLAQLTAQRFETLSLIVSRLNQRALALYKALGMQDVFTFPVFVWEA